VKGRIDHLALDPSGQRLFLAALGNNSVEVADLDQGKVTGSIAGLQEPQGVVYVPERDRLFVGCGGDGTVKIIDGSSLRILRSVDLGSDADNLRYAPREDRIYAGYGAGGLAALDPGSGAVLADLKLPAHPESFQIEEIGERIFANLPGENAIAVLDRRKGALQGLWSAGPARSNFPMALDEADRRLFVGMRRPARLRIFDTGSGKPVAETPIGGDADDIHFDPARRRILVSCGAGEIDLIEALDRDRYRNLARFATVPGARTSLYDPGRGELYLAVPARGAQAAEIRIYRFGEARKP
jgi:WD40 repeat protein